MENEREDESEVRPGARRSSYIPPAEDSDFVPRLPDISELSVNLTSTQREPAVSESGIQHAGFVVDGSTAAGSLRAPVRTSLTDVALSDLMSEHSGIPLDERMLLLEDQMIKRDADVRAYTQFLNAVRADGSSSALELFERVKVEFRDVIAGTGDIRFRPAVTDMGDVSDASNTVPAGLPDIPRGSRDDAAEPHAWTLGINHSVPEPEHRVHDTPSRWGAVVLWLGLGAAPVLAALGYASADATAPAVAAVVGVIAGILAVFALGSRVSRHTNRGGTPLSVVIGRAFGPRLGRAIVRLVALFGLVAVVWFGSHSTASLAQALIDSRLVFDGYAAVVPVIATTSVVVFGTVFALLPRRASRVLLIALGAFSATAGLGVALLGAVRLMMSDSVPELGGAFADTVVTSVNGGLLSAVAVMMLAGPTLSGLAHRNGRPGAVIAASIGGGLGVMTFVGMIASLSMTPTYYSAAGNAVVLWGDNVGILGATILSAVIIAIPAEFAIAVAVRTIVGINTTHRDTVAPSRRSIGGVVASVAILLVLAAVITLVPAVLGAVVYAVLGGAVGIVLAAVLGALAVDTLVRRPVGIVSSPAAQHRIVPFISMVLGALAGIAVLPIFPADESATLPTVSILDRVAADLGYTILYVSEMPIAVALIVSACFSALGLRTVVRSRLVPASEVHA
ncbi:hypothetical protein C8A06_1387 [Microbacteriaceae bacterium MWH-Ta3]|nr:hypothetical protein C8A06_1387 [Microbacteriaceae bacterium MWH-Ta3]